MLYKMKSVLFVLVISAMEITQWSEARHKLKNVINPFQQNNTDSSRNSLGGVSKTLNNCFAIYVSNKM